MSGVGRLLGGLLEVWRAICAAAGRLLIRRSWTSSVLCQLLFMEVRWE